MQPRWQVQSLKKGSQIMQQYISHSKDLIDHILTTGDNLSDKEQLLYVLGGLDVAYESLVTTITNKKRCLVFISFSPE